MNKAQRIYEQLSAVDAVSGGEVIFKAPQGRRHLLTRLFCSATHNPGGGPVVTTNPLDIIEGITTLVANAEQRVEKVVDIIAQRAFWKLMTDPSGALVLYYAEPHRADVDDETLFAWPLVDGEGDITYKIKFKSGLTNPSVKAVNVYDGFSWKLGTAADSPTAKQIIRRFSVNKSMGTIGQFINEIPINLPIMGIYLKAEAGKTIDRVKVTANNTQVIHDMTRQENAAFLSDYNLDATQFSYPLRFDVEGRARGRLEDIRALNVEVYSSAAQSVEAIVEQVAPDYRAA
jgi:hypothetical protein